jgi:hypothetical protein
MARGWILKTLGEALGAKESSCGTSGPSSLVTLPTRDSDDSTQASDKGLDCTTVDARLASPKMAIIILSAEQRYSTSQTKGPGTW